MEIKIACAWRVQTQKKQSDKNLTAWYCLLPDLGSNQGPTD